MTDREIVAGIPVFRPGLSSMSPQTNKNSIIKTKQNPKLKKQKTAAAIRNDFVLKYLALDVALKIPIPISTHHCVVLIGIISNGNPYEQATQQ